MIVPRATVERPWPLAVVGPRTQVCGDLCHRHCHAIHRIDLSKARVWPFVAGPVQRKDLAWPVAWHSCRCQQRITKLALVNKDSKASTAARVPLLDGTGKQYMTPTRLSSADIRAARMPWRSHITHLYVLANTLMLGNAQIRVAWL